jgi:hypothetical protein
VNKGNDTKGIAAKTGMVIKQLRSCNFLYCDIKSNRLSALNDADRDGKAAWAMALVINPALETIP